MSELDSLMSKSKEDLEAIAAQFGDYTPSVAKTKSREELIASITRMSVRDVVDAMEKKDALAPSQAPASEPVKTVPENSASAPDANAGEEETTPKQRIAK